MRTLTRLPADLRAALVAIDPADPHPTARPEVDEVLAGADTMEVLSTVDPRRRTGWLAPAAAAMAIIVVVVGVAVTRPAGDHVPVSPPATDSGPAVGSPATPSAAASGIADQLWADFPVDADPRPIVLIGQPVEDPVGGFRDSDTKIAYIDGDVTLGVPLPSTPGTRDGYPLVSASDALSMLKGPEVSGVTVVPLKVTDITLTDHVFTTDRGPASLPAWQVTFATVTNPAYILAIAQSARYDGNSTVTNDYASNATISRDGKTLVVPFVAYQAPAPCEPGFADSISVAQTSTIVIVATTSTVMPAPGPSTMACADVGRVGVGPRSTPYTPGEADTKTITLSQPLGNRAVVDADGHPYVVTGP